MCFLASCIICREFSQFQVTLILFNFPPWIRKIIKGYISIVNCVNFFFIGSQKTLKVKPWKVFTVHRFLSGRGILNALAWLIWKSSPYSLGCITIRGLCLKNSSWSLRSLYLLQLYIGFITHKYFYVFPDMCNLNTTCTIVSSCVMLIWKQLTGIHFLAFWLIFN